MTIWKKTLSLMALAACLSASLPKESHAIIVANVITGDRSYNFDITHSKFVNVVLCAFLFPVCVLDGKALPQDPEQIGSNLRHNGYTPSEIEAILADQAKLAEALKAKGQNLVVEPSDTVDTVGSAVRALVPEVSNLYIEYLTEAGRVQ